MDFSQPVLDHIFDRYHNITSIDIWSSVTSLAETEAGVGGRPVRVLQSAKILHGQNRWKPKTRKVSKKTHTCNENRRKLQKNREKINCFSGIGGN